MAVDFEAMRALPIQGYLDYKGIDYTVEHNKLRLVEHDSLIVNLDKNQFYWNSRQKSGDLGNFIEAYDDISSKEAWVKWAEYGRYYNGQDTQTKQKYTERPKNDYKFDFAKWRTADTTRNSQDYLVKERGLDSNFVSNLANAGFIKQGMARKDRETGEWQKPALLFPWYDETGKVVGLDQQGTSVDFEKFGKRGTEKKVAAGADTRYGYNFRTGNGADELIVFEAPIDALSFAQMRFDGIKDKNVTLLSLSGTDHQKVLAELDRMNKANGHLPKRLIMATDADLAGYKAADVFDTLQFDGMQNLRVIPKDVKDWNDQLKSGKNDFELMSMAENHERLTALQAFADKAQSTKLNDNKVIKDEKRVAVAGSGRAKTRFDREHDRNERKQRNRVENEKIIKDALDRTAAYKNDPVEIQRYLDFVANGQNYSPRNTMLIYGQRQDATIVMGYKQFAERGIQVNKGEKGMKIYGAPSQLQSIVDENGHKVYWRDATPEQRQAAKAGQLDTHKALYYPVETVFDIKQTNATVDQLPELLPNRPVNLQTENSPEQLERIYQTLKEYAVNEQKVAVIDDAPESVQFLAAHKPMTSNGVAKGALVVDKNNPENASIVLRHDLPATDRISTLAHEMGHASLHRNTKADSHPTHIKELQAELTSYVVLKNMGIEPGDGSERYMSEWTDGLKKLADYPDKDHTLLADVTKASTAITSFLSDKLSNGETIQYEQRVDRTQQAARAAEQQALQDQANDTQGRTR
ncbi:ArdC-like ssDNA-binding domain-containing protein [Weissella cibaria]|uniref:ArdC-like ssDNA-binding domain-containing protein n=1 Tax=Weissella cibaria TaxID=137591 RepID=UPI00376EA6B9